MFSIDASLMCMIFALGTCSGAHFNPAVIIAIVAAGRDKCCPQDAGITSLPSSLPESLQSSLTAMEGKSFPLGPGKGYGWAEAATAEIMFTFLLQVLSELLGTCFLILTVSLNVLGGSKAPVFSIDASLTCMIFALGTCSGAHFINTPENIDDDEIYTFDEKAIDAGVVLSCLCDMFWLDSTVVFVLSAWG